MELKIYLRTVIHSSHIERSYFFDNPKSCYETPVLREDEGRGLSDDAKKYLAKEVFPDLSPEEIGNCFGEIDIPYKMDLWKIYLPKDRKIIRKVHKKIIKFLRKGIRNCLSLQKEKKLRDWLWEGKQELVLKRVIEEGGEKDED